MAFWGKRYRIGITLLLCAALLSGCSQKSSKVITETAEADALLTPDPALSVSLEVKAAASSPRILVDQNGYRTGAEKMAVFVGTSFPETYEIRRTSDNETVFTGKITENGKASASLEEGTAGTSSQKMRTAYATFTDFQSDGSYYLYADTLGTSCAFEIGNDVYANLYKSALRSFYLNRCGIALTQEYAQDDARGVCHSDLATMQEDPSVTLDVTGGWHLDEKADRDVAMGCEVVNNLLLAYEMNNSSFTDDVGIPESGNDIPDVLDEVKYEIDWLLKMQDTESGGVYASALTTAAEGENLSLAAVVVTPVSVPATIDFAGTLSWFAYLYQDYDNAFSRKCLTAAGKAYECFDEFAEAKDYEASFLAAAQLYRMTGNKHYENVLTLYFHMDNYYTKMKVSEDLFLGGICYLMTKQPVNTNVCSDIMETLMDEAEQISNVSNRSDYYVAVTNPENVDEVLWDMRCMTVTNHILFSQEYTEIIEDHAHYLLGRNPSGANFAYDETEYTYRDLGKESGILYDPVKDAEFLVLLGAINA